jgi:hypothetical protein
MRKLYLRPNSSGYTATAGNEVVSAATEGGASRSRRDYIGAPAMISVAWMLDESGFDYLNAFFRTITKSGSLPFLCDLLFDRPYLVEHTCKFIPGSFKPIASTAAFTFNAIANFEVLPQPVDEDEDLNIVAYWEATNGMPIGFPLAGRIDHIANVVLPEYL